MSRCAPLALALGLLGCGGAEPLNGCDPARAQDRSAADRVVIEFAGEHGHRYVPACVRARVGSALVFRGPFALHPLGAGRLVDGLPEPDPANPLRDTSSGEEAVFRLETPGAFGFFCHFHTGEGMMGAVFVEAPR